MDDPEYTFIPCSLDELYKTANEEEKEWIDFLKQFVIEYANLG